MAANSAQLVQQLQALEMTTDDAAVAAGAASNTTQQQQPMNEQQLSGIFKSALSTDESNYNQQQQQQPQMHHPPPPQGGMMMHHPPPPNGGAYPPPPPPGAYYGRPSPGQGYPARPPPQQQGGYNGPPMGPPGQYGGPPPPGQHHPQHPPQFHYPPPAPHGGPMGRGPPHHPMQHHPPPHPQQQQYQQQSPRSPPAPMPAVPTPMFSLTPRGPRGGPRPKGQQLRLNDSECMSGRELAQIVRNQLLAVQSGDPYSDDYYFLKHSEKQRLETIKRDPALSSMHNHLRASAASSMAAADRPTTLLKEMTQLHKMGAAALGISLSSGHRVALPLINDGQVVDTMYERESKRDMGRREWEKTNRILGHMTKANLKRPRELITLVPLDDDISPGDESESDSDGSDDEVILGAPSGSPSAAAAAVKKKKMKKKVASSFDTATWKIRGSIEEAANTVLEVEDMHRLLKAKLAGLPSAGNLTREQGAAQDEADEVRSRLKARCNHLGTLVGLSAIAVKPEPATLAQVAAKQGSIEKDDEENVVKVTCALQQLLNIIWLPKGRRVVCRVIPCLLPAHHTALMASLSRLLNYFVAMKDPTQQANDEDPVQRELSELDDLCTETFVKELQLLDLAQLNDCLAEFLDSITPDQVRAVISTPGGSGVVRELCMRGQLLSEGGAAAAAAAAAVRSGDDTEKGVTEAATEAKALGERWEGLFARFIEAAETGISAREQATA